MNITNVKRVQQIEKNKTVSSKDGKVNEEEGDDFEYSRHLRVVRKV